MIRDRGHVLSSLAAATLSGWPLYRVLTVPSYVMPDGLRMLSMWVIFGAALHVVYRTLNRHPPWIPAAFGILALVFNPLTRPYRQFSGAAVVLTHAAAFLAFLLVGLVSSFRDGSEGRSTPGED